MDGKSDPRVGSARDNSSSTSVSRLASGTNSSSLSSLFATLVPVLIYAGICIAIFWVGRRKTSRVYSPRSILGSLAPHERSPRLPSGWFNWIVPFFRIPDTFVLDHSSLDGFLFLRYLKILGVIYSFGLCLTWPILLPLHATGGGGLTDLDMLTFGNLTHPDRFYAHAVVAWIYFGFVLYMISRECVYYINLRQAYLLSPYYANRLSSRTVLFTCVPREYLEEQKLRKVFGDSVKTVWIPGKTKELDELVEERKQTAFRLEKAEIALIKKANAARTRAIKVGDFAIKERPHPYSKLADEKTTNGEVAPSPSQSSHDDVEIPSDKVDHEATIGLPLPDVNGSVASQWIPHSARPSHRPIANKGRRVDTIKWTRGRIKTLNFRINKLRRQQLLSTNKKNLMPAAFIEFTSQAEAQGAYQSLSHHRAMHMFPRFIGVRPYEIIWQNMSMAWWERIIRQFAIDGFVSAMIIFWSIPCALIGMISNIDLVSKSIPFLGWIRDLPEVILGLIEGLLPALALSWLMGIVPAILRFCAKVAGLPTLSLIELYSQTGYFAFSVVQVFLITTLTSAASAAFTQILEKPAKAESLLSTNLPKASNFYISYFLVQNLGAGASALVQMSSLFRQLVIQRFTSYPRKLWLRWHRLERPHWGKLYPVYTNMAVIALSYCCIAPVVLGFASVGLWFVYVIYRYNFIFVYDSEISTMGLSYPRALMQTLVGLYFAEICLIGLFTLKTAYGPLVMTVGLLVFSILIHYSLYSAVGPLLASLPKTLTRENEKEMSFETENNTSTTAPQTVDPDNFDFGQSNDFNFGLDDIDPDADPDAVIHTVGTTRGETGSALPEGTSNVLSTATDFLKTTFQTELSKQVDIPAMTQRFSFLRHWITPSATETPHPNFFLKWLHPEVFSDYSILRNQVPDSIYPDPTYPPALERYIYYQPSMYEEAPLLWIPRDTGAISRQEVDHTGKVNPITDEGAEIDEQGKVSVELEVERRYRIVENLRW